MFRTKDFIQTYEYVKTYSRFVLDSNIYKYCNKINKLWAQTIKTKAYHLTWDSYNEKDNYYKNWKFQFDFNQIWHKNKYCGYTIYEQGESLYVKNKRTKRFFKTFLRNIKYTLKKITDIFFIVRL